MKMNYVVTVGIVLALSFALMRRERYRTLQSAYKYAFVDTNPARRVSGPFDACAPESWPCDKR